MGNQTAWTVADLLATHFPDPAWVVPGLLPVGFGILAGRPKMGKSLLALRLALAVGCGGLFLGRKVDQGHVLYLALEDGPRRLKTRLHRMNADPGADVTFELTWRPLNGGLDPRLAPGSRDLVDYVRKKHPRLIVVDTVTRACTGRLDWDNLAQVTGIMAALQEIATSEQVAILLVDHLRKRNGFDPDIVEDILGSTGKSAVSDTLWGLYRKRGERAATLAVTGRDIEEQKLVIEWDAATWDWVPVGPAGKATSDVQEAILKAIDDLGGAATITEIASYLGKDKGNTAREVAELVFARKLQPGPRVGRSKPYVRVPDDPFSVASV